MPIGYWIPVALYSWGVVCALTRWRRLGSFSAIPALLASELPFIVGYLLIASTVLALVNGDLGSPGGAAEAVVALFALAGLMVVVRRTLDVYHRRDRQAGAPVLLHFHGGGFYSGNKAREARPLIRYLASRRGFVCVSADYRLQPHVTLAGQAADVRDAIAWVRAHAGEYGADPGTLFVAGRRESGGPGGVRERDRHRGPDLPLRLLRRPHAARRHAAHAHRARRERHADIWV